MTISMLGLLVAVLVIGLVWWALVSLIGAFGIPDPLATIVKVVFVIAVAIWLWSSVLGLGPAIYLR